MPELPEVEVIRQQLDRLLTNNFINRTSLLSGYYPIENSKISKSRVLAVKRWGKYLFLDIGENYLVFHLGMSGRFRLEVKYKQQKHDHFGMEIYGGKKLIFSDPRRFGKLELVRKEHLVQLHRPGNFRVGLPYYGLGPDALCRNLVQGSKRQILSFWKEEFDTKTLIKSALLDQSRISGIGNIYSDEVLFLSKINPSTPANALKTKHLERISTNLTKIFNYAIMCRGSSLKDANSFLDLYGNPGETKHQVYGREGKKCLSCRMSKIELCKGSGRSSRFCPTCQPL